MEFCDELYVTKMDGVYPEADVIFPVVDYDKDWELTSLIPGEGMKYCIYRRSERKDESQYLDLLDKILHAGHDHHGCKAIFGEQLHFSLRNGKFPLLTTKKMFTKGIIEELLWILRSGTNCSSLIDKGVNIWTANGSREYLDSKKLYDYPEFELGPVYGFQLRRFGEYYDPLSKIVENRGVDQLQSVVDSIRNNPESRRHIISYWNPLDLPKQALPPCHILYQFHVNTNDNSLSCHMTQRSADSFLGLPFNISSTSLFTMIVAKMCNLKPNEITISIGNAHIYLDHMDAVKEQLTRTAFDPPSIDIPDYIEDESIDDYINRLSYKNILVTNYDCWPTIKAKLIV